MESDFIFQPYEISSIDDILAFENRYRELVSRTPQVWNEDIGEWCDVDFNDGSLDYLLKGRFSHFASDRKSPVGQDFIKHGLTELEALVLSTFLADISGLYRLDSYHYGVPPFVENICRILDNGLSQLPPFEGEVYRRCNEYDKADFTVGEIFAPSFALTTSFEQWNDSSENLYIIKTLPQESTKARNIYAVRSIGNEYQVTFMRGARFVVNKVEPWGNGLHSVTMQEI